MSVFQIENVDKNKGCNKGAQASSEIRWKEIDWVCYSNYQISMMKYLDLLIEEREENKKLHEEIKRQEEQIDKLLEEIKRLEED